MLTGARRRRSIDRIGLAAILGLVVLSAGLRLVDLDRNPPELFEDELSGAVSAWSIVTTGHDVERTVLPFAVTRLELKQPMYFMATVPFQAVMGHGTLPIRIPAVLFGIASTLLIVWLLYVLRAGRRAAYLGGLLFAISPWAIHYGRAGWEPASFLPFAIGGIGLLWIGLGQGRRAVTVAAAAVFALGAYTYHPALLMNVVMALAVTAILARRLTRRDATSLVIGGLVALVILVPYGLAATDPVFLERTRDLSVFRDGFSFKAMELAWSDFWAQWSPAYLLGGTAPNPRINPGPLVYVWIVPFFLIGLDRLGHRRRPEDILLLAWLVLGALPAAISDDRTTPHAARGLMALPAIVMISGIGIDRAIRLFERRPALDPFRPLAGVAMVVVVVASVVAFERTYLGEYVDRSANWWGYGSGAALRAAGEAVPAGGDLCIATNDISGFTFAQQMAYYLPDPGFTIHRTFSDAACQEGGTYLLAFVDRDLKVAATDVATIPDFTGDPLFRLARVNDP